MSPSGDSIPALNENSPIKGADEIKAELEKYNLKPVEVVQIVNEITGNKAEVTIERDGTPESKLILALANKELPREQKDHILSMYLWERGKESSSFLMDLIRHKGTHTKETRVFKSQMRFDFENMMDSLCVMYHDLADIITKHIGKRPTDGTEANVSVKSLIEAMWEVSELSHSIADKLTKDRANITRQREVEKGWGIYVAKDGLIYSINDSTVDEVIRKDKEQYGGQGDTGL